MIRRVVQILRSAPTLLTGAVIGCTHILPEQTAYYLDGPQQKQQSEGDLPAGSKAIIVGWRDDYLRVWADNGIIAYVWKGSVMTLSDWDRREKERKEREELKRRQEQASSAPASKPAQ